MNNSLPNGPAQASEQGESKVDSAKIIRKNFVSDILLRVAPSIGATIELEEDYGFVGVITLRSGKRVLFKDRNFNVNPQGSSEIARDKGYTSYFLKRFGFQIPRDLTVFSDKFNAHLRLPRGMEDGLEFARSVGFPVMLKPHNLSQGALISKVHNKREFVSAAKAIFKKSHILIIQEYVPGSDYRIVVLDNEVISAYERRALQVVGDGRSTVTELLHLKQEEFVRSGRDTNLDFSDVRIAQKLRRSKMNLESVPPLGTVVRLLDIANLSTGGDAVDVTEIIHPEYVKLAVRIASEFGLRLCGVDLITSHPIDQPVKDYFIIEINSAPGLDNYASIGEKQVARVDDLYRKVMLALDTNPSETGA